MVKEIRRDVSSGIMIIILLGGPIFLDARGYEIPTWYDDLALTFGSIFVLGRAFSADFLTQLIKFSSRGRNMKNGIS